MQAEPVPVVITTEQFTDGVAEAAQMVAAVHRKRLVAWGFIAGLLSTAIVALPLLFFTAKANCDAIRQLASATEQRFVESKKSNKAFRALSSDRFGLTEDQFEKLLKRNEGAEARQIHSTNQVAHRNCALV